jgi:hypothetical protein
VVVLVAATEPAPVPATFPVPVADLVTVVSSFLLLALNRTKVYFIDKCLDKVYDELASVSI